MGIHLLYRSYIDRSSVYAGRAIGLQLKASLNVPLHLLRLPLINELLAHLEGDDLVRHLVEVTIDGRFWQLILGEDVRLYQVVSVWHLVPLALLIDLGSPSSIHAHREVSRVGSPLFLQGLLSRFVEVWHN